MKVLISALALAAILAGTKECLADDSVRHWVRTVDRAGQEFQCLRVTTRTGLIDFLQDAGWDVAKGIPEIYWESEIAVLVALSEFHEGWHLEFRGVAWEDGKAYVDHGWRRILPVERQQGQTITIGSVGQATREALVVAVSRNGIGNAIAGCRNWKFRPRTQVTIRLPRPRLPVKRASNASSTVPMGPWRCLPMIAVRLYRPQGSLANSERAHDTSCRIAAATFPSAR